MHRNAMRILSENSILNSHTRSAVSRVVSITAGLVIGITVTLHGIQASRQPSSVISESTSAATKSSGNTIQKAVAKSDREAGVWHEIGLASWYGAEFQGKQTADGELFDMHDLTCAHRSLPLGTWVKVTNLHTHKWIVARVNDRGPVPDTRITDLSSEAAHMLGMRNRGVTRVRLDVIDSRQAVEIARLEKIRMARLAAAQADSIEPGD